MGIPAADTMASDQKVDSSSSWVSSPLTVSTLMLAPELNPPPTGSMVGPHIIDRQCIECPRLTLF